MAAIPRNQPEPIAVVTQTNEFRQPMNAKTRLFQEVLGQLKQRAYFKSAEVAPLARQLGLKISDGTLSVYLSEATATGLIHDAGRGWYSSLAKVFELDTRPVKPLITKLEKQFPLLDFHCWATAQINPYMHHLLGKSVSFVNTDSDAMPSVAEFLKDAGYDVHLNPRGGTTEQFAVRQKTVVVRRRVLTAPVDNHFARIEAVLVDLFLESQRLNLMDPGEFRNMARAIASAGRIDLSDLAAYAADRKQTGADIFGNEWIN